MNRNRRHDKKIAEHRALMAAARRSENAARQSAAWSAKQDRIFADAQRHALAIDVSELRSSLDNARRESWRNELSEDRRVYFSFLAKAIEARAAAQ